MRKWWVDKDYLENIHETKFDERVSLDAAVEVICRHLAVE